MAELNIALKKAEMRMVKAGAGQAEESYAANPGDLSAANLVTKKANVAATVDAANALPIQVHVVDQNSGSAAAARIIVTQIGQIFIYIGADNKLYVKRSLPSSTSNSGGGGLIETDAQDDVIPA
tara:strand:+ start:345 stop:716 length:372 start_codon:yes stop_codon:yes gene_type:complete